MRALRQNNIRNEIVVARDGVEALDHLLGGTDRSHDRRATESGPIASGPRDDHPGPHPPGAHPAGPHPAGPRPGGPAGVPPLPVLVLLDLNLPRINGLEVLETIRASPRTCLLPVVVLTSSREDQDIIASYRFGANSYVRKPVEFAAFSAAVRELGVYWLLLNQAPPAL
jgi:two-component system response regulator